MYVIIWEYQVKAERIAEFEQLYHPEGRWAELFKKGNGYLETELLHDPEDRQRYIIDGSHPKSTIYFGLNTKKNMRLWIRSVKA